MISYKDPLMIIRNKAPEYVKQIMKIKRHDSVHLNFGIYQVGYDNKLNKIFGDTSF